MGKNDDKQCPNCGGAIDYFGSCKRCGREWSEGLEEGEQATGLPEGQQHPAKKKTVKKTVTRTRYTKNRNAADPSKFDLWQIDVANDTETEIIRKRSLMHLDSRKAYNTLGLSLRARRSQKEALLWLSRLWELLSEEDQKRLSSTLQLLKRGFADIDALTEHKMAETAVMEKALEKAHSTARVARMKIIKADAEKKAKDSLLPGAGQDSEGFGVPTPVGIKPEDIDDPELLKKLKQEELLEVAKARLANLDKEKGLKKRSQKPEQDPTE
jgi:hypothetical protein